MKKKIVVLFILMLGVGWFASISTMLSNPQKLEAHIEKAQELEEKGIYVDAIDEYQEALKYRPNDVQLMVKMAEDYLEIDEKTKYESTLKQAIELEKDGSEEALDTLMEYYIDGNSEAKAVQYIKDYTEKSPKVEYAQEWLLKLKGSYRELYCKYDEMLGMYNDYMVVKSGDFYSIIDASGNRILDAKYKQLTSYSADGYAQTVDEKGNTIYIDKDGLTRVVPDEKYQKAGILNDSRIAASLDGKFGYLDEKAEEVTEFKWDNITGFNQIGAAESDGKWALIDSKGKEKTEYIYDDVVTDEYGIACYQGRLFVKVDGKYELVNKKGKTISDEKFDDVKPFTETGYAAVCKDKKWGFVDTDGKLVIDYQYDDALSFENGYAAVCKNNLWGYIDVDDNLIIDTTLVEATSFSSEGSAAIKIKGKDEDQQDEWKLIKLNIES